MIILLNLIEMLINLVCNANLKKKSYFMGLVFSIHHDMKFIDRYSNDIRSNQQ